MTHDPTPELIAEIRAAGDLKDYFALLTGRPVKPAPAPKAAAPEPEPDPNHRPGAWPTGTRPPGPVAPQDPAAWDRAVYEYRAWNDAGRPIGDYRCQCGCTPAA